ncbi:hypothetical protein BH10BDE1_BH10BDE1_29010 [soil metagenome]
MSAANGDEELGVSEVSVHSREPVARPMHLGWPMMKLKNPSILRAFLMTAVLAASSSVWAQSAIKDVMKEEIGPSFKVIFTDLKAHTISAKAQSASKTLLHGLTEIQNAAPEFVPDGANARAITPTEASAFKEQARQTLSFAVLLDRALTCGAGEVPEVWKAFASELVKAKFESAERPAPANLDNVVLSAEILKVLSNERKSAHDRYKPET